MLNNFLFATLGIPKLRVSLGQDMFARRCWKHGLPFMPLQTLMLMN